MAAARFSPPAAGWERRRWVAFGVRGVLGVVEYRWAVLIVLPLWIVAMVVTPFIFLATQNDILTLALPVLFSWIYVALIVKRVRDTGLSGLFCFGLIF